MTTEAVVKAWVKRNYLNHRFTGSYSGLSGFLQNRNKWKEKKVIEKELQKVKSFSLHRDIRHKYPRRKMMVKFVNEIYSADLKDVSNLSKHNRNINWLLIVIDAFSKKSYVRPLKNKNAETVIKALKSVFKESGAYPVYLFTDMGKDFTASIVRSYLKENKKKLYHVYSTVKSAFAERWIRTLFSKLQRYMTERNTKTYIDKLPESVKTYNNTYSRIIGRSPNKVKPEDSYEIWERMFGSYIDKQKLPRRANKFQVNDLVRISKAKLLFEKGNI